MRRRGNGCGQTSGSGGRVADSGSGESVALRILNLNEFQIIQPRVGPSQTGEGLNARQNHPNLERVVATLPRVVQPRQG